VLVHAKALHILQLVARDSLLCNGILTSHRWIRRDDCLHSSWNHSRGTRRLLAAHPDEYSLDLSGPLYCGVLSLLVGHFIRSPCIITEISFRWEVLMIMQIPSDAGVLTYAHSYLEGKCTIPSSLGRSKLPFGIPDYVAALHSH